jgi:leucyl aminopeptidase
MKTVIQSEKIENVKGDVIVSFHFQDKELLEASTKQLDELLKGKIQKIIKLEDFKGKAANHKLLYTDGAIKADRILLIGLGEKQKLNLNTIRKAAAKAAKAAEKNNCEKVVFHIPDLNVYKNILHTDIHFIFQAMLEGALLSLYKFDKYKSKEKDEKEVSEFLFITDDKKEIDGLKKIISSTLLLCESVKLARDLSNAPACEINPLTFSDKAKEISKKHGIRCTILKRKEIEAKKMGGLLAVSSGSAVPPRFVILEYNLDKVEYDTIVLVGKGITFDSGGISLKPSSGMAEMKMDMSGAAVVLGAMEAAAKLKLPIRLTGLIPLCENMPGGTAQKPGDIITISNGKTVEVDNTDAEGRLILADALVYAGKYKPKAVIDLATLTGAVVVALGHVVTGMMGTNRNMMDRLKIAGEATNERVWELPLYEEYDELIKSDIADVKNVGGKWGGAITAGMFLKKFADEYPWVHLDIAGTAMYEKNTDYEPKGGTGIGVRLLIEFLKSWGK